jgi:hypothetical protein
LTGLRRALRDLTDEMGRGRVETAATNSGVSVWEDGDKLRWPVLEQMRNLLTELGGAPLTVAELHRRASRTCRDADPTLRAVAGAVLRLLVERAGLTTTEYHTLREDLKIARSSVANYERELARMWAVHLASPAAWDAAQATPDPPFRDGPPTSLT